MMFIGYLAPTKPVAQSGRQRLDRLGARVLRLLHLRHRGVADLSADLLSEGRPDGRHRRVARDLRRGLCRAARSAPSSSATGATRTAARTCCIVCMFLMGISTMAVGLLPTYEQVGLLAPVLLVILRLIQGFAVAGEISGASSMILEHAPFGRRGFFASFTLQGVQAGQILAAAVFLPLAALHARPRPSTPGAGAFRSCSASSSSSPATSSAARSTRRRPSPRKSEHGEVPKAPIVQAFQPKLARHAARRLHGADERHPRRHDDLRRRLCGAAGLRHRLRKGRLSVDPGARQHRSPCSSSRSSAICPTRSAAGRRSSSARSALGPARRSPTSTRSASTTCRSRSSCRC